MSANNNLTVGFIGIGNMGWPMASHIKAKGYHLSVFDTDAKRASDFAQETGASAVSLAELASADVIITMLPTGQIVREVLLESAEGAFINNARAGTIVVDMSSSEPTDTQALGQELAEKKITLIDAPVSGAVPRAKLGTLTIMAGGNDKAALEKVKPILLTMGDRVFDTGDLGSGHAVKALNNFIAATSYTATAEALLIAERFGLDKNTLIDIVNVSTGQTFISEKVVKEHLLEGKYATGFALGLLAKDVGIAADLGAAVNLDAPLSRLIRDRWMLARDRLGHDADNTEAIKSWDDDLQN
ncbi:NAD(P)-dependent oxidoreductase [Gammaproteobacteria bacterium]|nr:NAD(P)-dependent oxidoreductase [Gammaproteobacteria bacterium]